MSYFIGVIGNIQSNLSDEEIHKKLKFLIKEAITKKSKYEDMDFDDSIYIVTGLIYTGIPKIVFQIAKELHYKIVGIDSQLAIPFYTNTEDTFKPNYIKFVEGRYGNEDRFFLKNIDILICLDGSERDRQKVNLAKMKNIPIIVCD